MFGFCLFFKSWRFHICKNFLGPNSELFVCNTNVKRNGRVGLKQARPGKNWMQATFFADALGEQLSFQWMGTTLESSIQFYHLSQKDCPFSEPLLWKSTGFCMWCISRLRTIIGNILQASISKSTQFTLPPEYLKQKQSLSDEPGCRERGMPQISHHWHQTLLLLLLTVETERSNH